MRIDRCIGCGERVDIASDHAPGCTRNVPVKTRAEVTPEVFESVKAALYQAEITGPRAGASLDALATAAITALTAAGFGVVADAKREALRDSAEAIENYAKDGADGDASPYETAAWLRARAREVSNDERAN